ncbi:MAG: glutathione S-transferase family protein [Sandaracinaceae bacterium]
MIDLFYYRTPNARKVLFCLEEVALPYRIRWVDITRGDQHTEPYRRINPNAKIPAIIDHDGPAGAPLTLFESGAILLYLAEKTGQLLPEAPDLRYETLQWVFWQMANQGPMLGQATHFVSYAPSQGIEQPYARSRYLGEARRLYEVLDERLTGREHLVGDAFSIADIACWPWVRPAKGQGIAIEDYPEVNRWSEALAARPAARVKPKEDESAMARGQKHTEAQWETLFRTAPSTHEENRE